MTVYVDDMKAKFRRMKMCHMIADTFDELHVMADRIGVARQWFQGDHYDIALSKRTRAIELGAMPITWRQASSMMALQRRGFPLPTPDIAVCVRQLLHNLNVGL